MEPSEAGRTSDALNLGVANDRTGIRPGLLKEVWDVMNGFAEWCNAQGGIAGIPVHLVDLDGKVLEVESATATACTDAFALVGGAFAQDNLMFGGKPGADFDECGLIAVPAFAVSAEFSENPNQVQPAPNPATRRPTVMFDELAQLFPEEVGSFGIVYGNVPSVKHNALQDLEVAKLVPGFGEFGLLSYDLFNQDWAQTAQQVVSGGYRIVEYVGESEGLARLSQALLDQDWDGHLVSNTNHYGPQVVSSAGGAAVEGIIVRVTTHPYEEADRWPAVAQFIDIMDSSRPGWNRSSLAASSFSAALLFATAARTCAEALDVVSRACVLEALKQVHQWDAGGLQAATDPGSGTLGTADDSACEMLMIVRDGAWERFSPDLGESGTRADGFECSAPVEIGATDGA